MTVFAILELRLNADELDKGKQAVHETLAQTRAFDGNVGVDVLVDKKDPAHLFVYEKWESDEHDKAYRAWRATPEGASQLGAVLAGAPTLTLVDLDADI